MRTPNPQGTRRHWPAVAPQHPPGPRDRPASVPPGVRAISALTAALVASGAASGVHSLVQVQDPSLPWTAAALVATLVPPVLLFAAIALRPAPTRRRVRDWTGADVADPLHCLSLGLATVTAVVVFGLGSIVETTFGLESLLVHGQTLDELSTFTEASILRSVGINLLVFLIPPVAWTLWVDGDPLDDAARRLGLQTHAPLRDLGWGVGLVLASFLVLAALAGVFHLAGIQPPDNERALALGKALTIPSALAVSAAASLGEEVFFRGWLQTKVGNLPQALLFSLAHFSYLNVLEALVTLALGAAFGYARDRTDSLLAPGLAHFGFNAITFVAIIYS